MSSQDVIKSTAKKLKYYMEVKRLEDAFDLSGPDKPQRHYPTLKPRPTLLYDGLHDRALKHYFRNAEVKKHLVQMKPRSSEMERESKVRRDVDRYMEKSHFTSPYTNLVRAKPPPKKRKSNFRGGPLLLRSRHGPQLSRGEAERLVNAATKLLVATLDQQKNGRRHSGKNFRVDSGVGSSLPMIDNGHEDYGHRPTRPERPKSTYGHRPTRPRSSYGERTRPRSAIDARPKSAAKTSPSTARYGYDSLGRRIKLHLEQPRHYEASESDQDPDDYDDDFEDSLDNGMNILVPVKGSGRNQSPEWLNIQMSKVDMNDPQDYEEEEEEEEEVEEPGGDTVSIGDEVLHSIDNTTQTGREISCQTVEDQDNTKDTQTRRANTEESMTDPYQADMAIQTAPPPVTSATQTVVPPPEASTQTVPPLPTTGTQTYPEVYCQTTPIMNMETQTEVHQPSAACQVEPPNEMGVQVDPPPPPPSPPPPPEPEPEPQEDYEFLKHGPRLKSGKRTIYELSIHTGNRLGASTRADVHVTLYGEKGNTGKIRLKQSKDTKDGKKVKFQKGQIDVFKVESYYVGKMECICIGHDRRELGCGWFLDKVMIREYGDDVTYEFLCERWLSAQDEDGQTVRTVPVTNIIMDVSSSSQSEPDHSDFVEKSPDSSAFTDTDLHLNQVTALDGHFVRTSPQAKKYPSDASQADRSDGSRQRRKHRRKKSKKGKGKGKSRRRDRTPVTTTGTESDTDTDTDSEQSDRTSRTDSDNDDDSDSGSGSSGSRSGSSSGSGSDTGSSSGSGSSSDKRKADGESKNGSIHSGRYRDRSSKGPKEENTEHLPKEEASDAASSHKENRTASSDDDDSSDENDDAPSRGSASQSDSVSRKSDSSHMTDPKDVPKPEAKETEDRDSTRVEDKENTDYMSGFKAALKMKEQQKEQQEAARVEEEEKRREEEESLLLGPSIHQSCKKGDLERIKKLTQHNAELINSPDERGWTPLHVASANGRLDIVKYLSSNDASINDLTPTGYTAMHMGAMNGHVAVVKLLAAMGMTVDCRTVDEQTPLHMAAMSGHLECTKWLVANNAPLDVIDNMGRTAYDLAEEYQHDEVMTFLRSCQRELTREDSSLAMLRSRSPSMGSQNRRSLSTSDPDSEKDTDKDGQQSSEEEDKPDSVAAKHKEEQRHAVLERKRSFKEQQERMSSTGMSFLDSIRAESSVDPIV
ncbi:uncharacterized protein LOC110980336 [Acanthaster planci]|uniref:Uncharacterized protein LOC110980336 n=1 Tax=Acanthaster planci TaxID=133434 RepID=A0A8B7YHA6_ACAPL|nr:uncharacterized protein LOC110980336 [Acanthaster planci]